MTKRIHIVTLVIESDIEDASGFEDRMNDELAIRLCEDCVLDTEEYSVTNINAVYEITGN